MPANAQTTNSLLKSAVIPPESESPLVKKNIAGTLGFLALCGLCMTNINFVTAALLGKEQVFSILYLVACLVVLFSFQFKISQAISAPGWFWVFAIAMFLGISTRFGFGIETAYFLSPQSNFYRIIIAQIITMCAAMGARHMILRGQSQLMLRVLFGFMVLAASTILPTKFFPVILKFIGQPMGPIRWILRRPQPCWTGGLYGGVRRIRGARQRKRKVEAGDVRRYGTADSLPVSDVLAKFDCFSDAVGWHAVLHQPHLQAEGNDCRRFGGRVADACWDRRRLESARIECRLASCC